MAAEQMKKVLAELLSKVVQAGPVSVGGVGFMGGVRTVLGGVRYVWAGVKNALGRIVEWGKGVLEKGKGMFISSPAQAKVGGTETESEEMGGREGEGEEVNWGDLKKVKDDDLRGKLGHLEQDLAGLLHKKGMLKCRLLLILIYHFFTNMGIYV